jgi:hypothetical protein
MRVLLASLFPQENLHCAPPIPQKKQTHCWLVKDHCYNENRIIPLTHVYQSSYHRRDGGQPSSRMIGLWPTWVAGKRKFDLMWNPQSAMTFCGWWVDVSDLPWLICIYEQEQAWLWASCLSCFHYCDDYERGISKVIDSIMFTSAYIHKLWNGSQEPLCGIGGAFWNCWLKISVEWTGWFWFYLKSAWFECQCWNDWP